jgi:hypothetical protein
MVAWAIGRVQTVNAVAITAWLQEIGRPAVATVLATSYQQEAIMGDLVMRTTARLTPTDGAPAIEGTRDMYLSVLSVPWIGGRVPAYYDPADPDRFLLITALKEETPPRVREFYQQIRAEQDAEVVVELAGQDGTLAAIAQLGRLEQQRRAGSLPGDEYSKQRMSILDRHFP